MSPKFAKPKKGNPHQLAIGQHIFPRRSIERFADADGRVQVQMKSSRPIWRAKPTNIIFCARRAWEHGTEVGFMKTIEDRFQQLADLVIAGGVSALDAEQMHTVSLFYALWVVRAEISDQPGTDAQLNGILPSRKAWSKDEEETLEKRGLGFFRGATLPVHVFNGPRIRTRVAYHLRQLSGGPACWGIIRASGGEFVVPDWPLRRCVPINPTLALATPADNQSLDRAALEVVNKQLRLTSRQYFFAKDLAACP
jgi:hypothetical protein